MLDETLLLDQDPTVESVDQHPADQTDSLAPREDLARYVLGRVLGRGALGEVRDAVDLLLGRRVAVKLPLRDRPGAESALVREAIVLSSLRHRGIERLYGRIDVAGGPWLVVERLDGPVLSRVIATRSCTIGTACRIVSRLALALDHCHRRGIVHGDVKPANVILKSHCEPVLVDFGLAFATVERDRMWAHGTVRVGSPAYMAPECFRDHPAAWGPAIDTYSLGVVFYELLTGAPPFAGTIGEVMKRCVVRAVESPTKRRPGIPSQVEQLCLALLRREPTGRPCDLRKVARDIRRLGSQTHDECEISQ
jgi:serine/threonine-protein kinase